MAWLRDTRLQVEPSEPPEKVVRFPNASPAAASHEGEAALDLIEDVANLIRSMEDQAAAAQLRARHLVQEAAEKLRAAETHIQSVEAERRVLEAGLNEANMRLHELEKVRQRTDSYFAAVEARLSAAELRANVAEVQAHGAVKALQRIEDAIRCKLLGQRQAGSGKLAAAA